MTDTDTRAPTANSADLDVDVDAALPLTLQLVAACYAPPRDAFLDELRNGTLQTALDQVAEAIGGTAPALSVPAADEVRSRHVDLFVSSAHAPTTPPYVGYARDGEILGPSAEAVGRFLAARGIGTDPSWPDLPDHVAAVAESAAILAVAGDDDAARTVARDWLLPWFDRYAAEVASKDDSGLYGPLTTFLHATLREVSRGHRS